MAQLKDALKRFHHYCQAFSDICMSPGSSLPQQHSLNHYTNNIRLFDVPNGLCTSIMEAKHIKAIKEPWRRTNHYKPLKQILYINQHLNKLYAMRTDFTNRGMLESVGLRASLETIDVFSTPLLPYKSHFENTPEEMHIDIEKPDNEAEGQVKKEQQQ